MMRRSKWFLHRISWLVILLLVSNTVQIIDAAPEPFPETYEGTFEGSELILDETAQTLGWTERTGGEY
ncbi:MAG: hypothetical protein ACP5GX_11305, partial [Anaerolineae bacterium]